MLARFWLFLILNGLSYERVLEFMIEDGNGARLEANDKQPEDNPADDIFKCGYSRKLRKIAFSAYFTSEGYFKLDYDKPIKFPAFTGSNYDRKTGKFTASRSGIYVFTVDVAVPNNTHDYVQLFVDHKLKIVVHPDARYATSDSASGTVVLELTCGEQVWVQLDKHGNNTLLGDRQTRFSGFLN